MCQIAILENIGVKFDPYKQKKSDTQACHSECLHNGIILIVYILQFVVAKVVLFVEIAKYFLINLHISYIFSTFAAELFIEILIKQLIILVSIPLMCCVLHTKVSLKS